MPIPEQHVRYRASQYGADSVCAHCNGVLDHEHWCSTQNSNVRYALQVVMYPDCMTTQDRLILHALGVAWEGKKR